MLRPLPVVLALFAVIGCATLPSPSPSEGRRVLLAFDDGRPDGAIAFPTTHHEAVVRFEFPPGEHRALRLWLQAAASGTLQLTFYQQTPLEGPGEVLQQWTRVVRQEEVSDGRDGRWVVDDLTLPAQAGVLWLGIRRADGEPTIVSSRVDAGQYFLRNHDPKNVMNLMPIRRTPMVRLEISP